MAGGNQNILNTAIHCASLTCRILVLSDETNCISLFFFPCHLIFWQQRKYRTILPQPQLTRFPPSSRARRNDSEHWWAGKHEGLSFPPGLSVLDFALQPREEAHAAKLSSCTVQCYRTVVLSNKVQQGDVHRRERERSRINCSVVTVLPPISWSHPCQPLVNHRGGWNCQQ